MRIQPVVLCGGQGRRLWPLSTAETPKPLLRLFDGQSLLQQTLERVSDQGMYAPPVLVLGSANLRAARAQAAEASRRRVHFIVEPCGRNTGPALAAACIWLRAIGRDPLVLGLPADAAMRRPEGLRRAVAAGMTAASGGQLVVFGVRPNRASIEHGYVEVEAGRPGPVPALRFREKPDARSAVRWIRRGGFLWNAGMVMARASVLVEEMESCEPGIVRAARRAVREGQGRGRSLHLAAGPWLGCPSTSFDRAVLERSRRVAVVRLEAGWSDLGTFEELRAFARGRGPEAASLRRALAAMTPS